MSLHVALVCPYSLDQPGGVATHVLGLARWLRDAGHRPVVVAPGTREQDWGVPVTLLGGSRAFRFNGSVAHLAVHPTQARLAVRAVLAADIVHVHEPLTPGVGFASARASAGRLVVTHHAAFAPGAVTAGLLRLRAALLPDRVTIAVSAAAARTARSVTGVEPVVIPNAVASPPPRPKPGAPNDGRPLVVFLGRVDEPRKGYPLFRSLARRMPEADFVAVGPGTAGDPVVTEVGQLDDAAKSRLLHEAAVLVAPNLYGESFGMIIVEALAHGCAVVASNLPAFRAVVDDPAVVTWFPAGDADAALTSLRTRLAAPVDPHRAQAAAARYTWPRVGPGIAEIYQRVAAGTDPGADVS